jgi:hypothetical protein
MNTRRVNASKKDANLTGMQNNILGSRILEMERNIGDAVTLERRSALVVVFNFVFFALGLLPLDLSSSQRLIYILPSARRPFLFSHVRYLI